MSDSNYSCNIIGLQYDLLFAGIILYSSCLIAIIVTMTSSIIVPKHRFIEKVS